MWLLLDIYHLLTTPSRGLGMLIVWCLAIAIVVTVVRAVKRMDPSS